MKLELPGGPAMAPGLSKEAKKSLREWGRRYEDDQRGYITPQFKNREAYFRYCIEAATETREEVRKGAGDYGADLTFVILTGKHTDGTTFTLDLRKEVYEGLTEAKPQEVAGPHPLKPKALKWALKAAGDRWPAMVTRAGDVLATDGHRMHRAKGVFPPSETPRLLDADGKPHAEAWESHMTPFGEGAFDSLMDMDSGVVDPKAFRRVLTFDDKLLKRLASFKKAVRPAELRLQIEGGEIRFTSNLEDGHIPFEPSKTMDAPAHINLPYLLDAALDFAVIHWPDDTDGKHPHAPFFVRNEFGEALIAPMKRPKIEEETETEETEEA